MPATAGTVNSGIEPGVGVYVNGVYYARPSIAVFDPGQAYLHVVDGTNNLLWTLSRSTGAVVAVLGGAGSKAGEFHAVHNLAIDSQGSLYTAEVATGRRVQKFDLQRSRSGSQ